jgi:hypothetical protein
MLRIGRTAAVSISAIPVLFRKVADSFRCSFSPFCWSFVLALAGLGEGLARLIFHNSQPSNADTQGDSG